MIRKIRILIILIILSFSFVVKAETMLDLTCYNKTIDSTNNAKCDVSLYYEMDSVNDIEFEYDTKLDIDFKKMDGFTLTKNDKNIKIHSDETLNDEIGDSKPMFQIILTNNSNLSEEEKLTFKNIKINNSTIIDDVSEIFDVVSETIEKDSTNTLESIAINDIKISNYDKNKIEYYVSIKEEIYNIKITRTSNKSTVEGVGSFRIASGESEIHKIKVTAENGDVKEYILHITNTNKKNNLDNLSKDNNLKSLDLYFNKEKIDFDFDNKKDSFDIKVNSNVNKVKIEAETNDTKAIFDKKYGPRDIDLKYGNNKIELKVYAEDYSSKVYTINIDREDDRESDNTLNSVKINGKEVIFDEFGKSEVILAANVLKTWIEAIPNSSKAKVFYEDINLGDGNNDVVINVTAENGEEKEYHVNVIREEENKISNVFSKIEVIGYNIDFSKDKYSYNLKIDDKTDELDIKIYPNSISFEVLNNKKLKQGSKIVIKITDDAGEHEYTIFIEKDSSLLNIICYSVFSIGVVLLAISIIRFITIKKKKRILKISE